MKILTKMYHFLFVNPYEDAVNEMDYLFIAPKTKFIYFALKRESGLLLHSK